MTSRLSGQLRRGVFGETRTAIALTLALLVAAYAVSLLYEPLNHGPNRIFLRTPLDQGIPLVPVFVIPYLSLTPFILVSMVGFLLFRARLLRSAAVALMVAWLVSFAFYLVLQSYVARPAVPGTGVLEGWLRDVYAGDRPYNDFPSLHTSLSTIIAFHWWRWDRRIGIPVAVWTLLIVASTVLVHQHYLADVGGGLLLAAIACTAGWRIFGRDPGAGSPAATVVGAPAPPASPAAL
jgi:membrane-associated phospholipid phosphatase